MNNLNGVNDAAAGINTVVKTLESYARSGSADALSFRNQAGDVVNLDESLTKLANNRWWDPDTFSSWARSALGMSNTMDQMKAAISQADTALAQMVSSGDADTAARVFERMQATWVAAGGTLDDFKAMLPQYQDALDGVADSTTGAAGAAAGLSKEVKTLDERLQALRGHALGVDQANQNLEQSFDDASKAAKENGRTLNAHTQGRAGQPDGVAGHRGRGVRHGAGVRRGRQVRRQGPREDEDGARVVRGDRGADGRDP